MTNAAIERTHDDDLVRQALCQVIEDQEAAFGSTLREGVASGHFVPDLDTKAYASLIVATLNGIRVLARIDPSPERLAAMGGTLMKGVISGPEIGR